MYYKTEPTPAFSEKPDFKVPSNWTPPIRDAPLELYISEIEDILLNINESSKSSQILIRMSVKHFIHLFTMIKL